MEGDMQFSSGLSQLKGKILNGNTYLGVQITWNDCAWTT